jgi:alkanesulfonate monooxygenase SsuD/methylene tetrahydromethanopterin reductase-like flavin-dependent oxidoreductase (luciferase family)
VKTGVFYLPSVGSAPDVQRGMAGVRPELYQTMLSDLAEQAVLADELGYDSIAFTEHHFHIEGFELSNNPVLLDLFVGLRTKRIPEEGETNADVGLAQMLERSLILVGSVDTVTRQLERLLARLPLDNLLAWQYISLIPNEKLKRSLELFATKVLPRVT